MTTRGDHSRHEVVAVIDIGSNSGRVMVFERDTSGQLRLIAGSRVSLRLVHDVDARGALREATIAHTIDALRDFQAIATRAGARRLVAVATAAMRDATNGARLVERAQHELGIRIETIGGPAEARYRFAGAVRGLPVSNGLLFDLGGGSVQITRFARRRLSSGVSLPFGALRLSERFLESDPPSAKQLRRLRDHVRSHLAEARVTRLAPDEWLVGTGGTLRNLAKIDRHARRYPISAVHGYELSVDRLGDLLERLATTRAKRRDDIPGLSADRADSIVGGAAAIHALAEFVRATQILVSGHGVREGIVFGILHVAMGSPTAVKEASLASLEARFDGWRPEAASRRRSVASQLQRALEPRAPAGVVMAIDHAARVLDIGRSLDLVNRHQHVADLLLSTELGGFAHHELALAAAIVRRAGDRHADVFVRDTRERGWVDRAAVILMLADEIEARCPPGRPIAVDCEVGRTVTLSVPSLPSWLVKDLDRRFERAFGRPLLVRH